MRPLGYMAFALTVLISSGSIALAAPDSGTFVLEPIGTPLSTGKMEIDVTIVVMGMKVTKTVTIPSGDIKPFERPKRMPNENIRDYAQRILDAQGEASQAKAKVIADAINMKFKDEFKKLGETAGAGLKVVTNRTINVDGQGVPGLMAPFGALVIPGVSKEKDQAGKDKSGIAWKENKVLGEGGNGGRFVDPGKPSPGSRGSLDRIDPGVTQVASGVDPLGDPSLVEFGIDGLYVAQVMPTAGMTDSTILGLLASLLDMHGVPAMFDANLHELFLEQPLLDGQTLVWGNTDTELAFRTSFEGLSTATVPEPTTAGLLAIGLVVGLACFRQRRSRYPSGAAMTTCLDATA